MSDCTSKRGGVLARMLAAFAHPGISGHRAAGLDRRRPRASHTEQPPSHAPGAPCGKSGGLPFPDMTVAKRKPVDEFGRCQKGARIPPLYLSPLPSRSRCAGETGCGIDVASAVVARVPRRHADGHCPNCSADPEVVGQLIRCLAVLHPIDDGTAPVDFDEVRTCAVGGSGNDEHASVAAEIGKSHRVTNPTCQSEAQRTGARERVDGLLPVAAADVCRNGGSTCTLPRSAPALESPCQSDSNSIKCMHLYVQVYTLLDFYDASRQSSGARAT